MGSYQTLCLGPTLISENIRNITSCLKIIENAWEGVTKRIFTPTWKKFWSESVIECDIEESESVTLWTYSQRRLCFLAKIRGLEVDSNDIEEIVE
ncbi:hypothetical protein AVEN_128957-1 [Araneus ventricosus]|uniref:DDE-1 domain-containing protein n=1 Tax=Araneus ventricosus TaxID=182803 RepID=A0A4Y2RQM9_ARAVE|nr:hypothetical protein AVEN_128957-1 [Araneus ventricosus]